MQRSGSRCFIFDNLQTYSIVLLVPLYHTLSSGDHINTDSAAPSVREVLLSAGTVEDIVTRCERWLEKRSSRPPPNSILRDIVLDSVDMILWVGKSATRPADVTYLLHHLGDHLLKELFIENGTVCIDSSLAFLAESDMVINRRPGILVLINDADWELEGEGEYLLQDGDEIVLISTLHGG